jgi:multicomponent Na+:H+ antiporter subunit D
MRILVPLPVVLPLLAAGISLALHRHLAVARFLGVAVLVAILGVNVAMLVEVERHGPFAVQVGGWAAPFGITLVADLLACLLLVVSTATVLAVLVYAIGSPRTRDDRLFFHPVYLILAAGVSLSFLTGDLFNLFVSFEVMLSASYVLITLGANRDQVRSGMTYVVISLVASTFFVAAVGLVYAATGTVNLADLAGKLDAVPPGVRTALGLLLLVVFGVKAAIFPLFFWLPDSYPTAPTPVTAIFAGLLTKVGVYAIIRTQTLLFPRDGPDTLVLFIAGATMVAGVLGAIAQDDIKRLLSFHIVSQIGYMILGLGLFTVAGVAGAIFFVVHQIVVKTTLFLVGGLIEEATGTGALKKIGGLLRSTPGVAVLFLAAALSLAGLPPFSGFVAKLALVQAGIAEGRYVIIAVSLGVSLLTLFSMVKIWAGVFWGLPEVAAPKPFEVGQRIRSPRWMMAATSALVVLSLAIAAGAGPLWDLSSDAAVTLIEREPYVRAVLP